MKTVQTNMNKLAAFIALAILVTMVTPAIARTKDKKETPIEVKYIGKINEQPVFQIQFDNETAGEILVTLRDEDGTVLYSESFSGKRFSKKFQFEKADISDIHIQVDLASKKKNESQVFRVNQSTRLVDEVVVSKLK